MTVGTVNLGGTDWSDGDVLYAADLIATFDATTMHYKTYTNATAYNQTGTTWDSKMNFTITAESGSLLQGIFFKCELYSDTNGTYAAVRLKISGSSLGTYYLDTGFSNNSSFVRQTGTDTSEFGGRWSSTESGATTFACNNTTHFVFSQGWFLPLALLDTTTTINVELRHETGGDQATIDEVEITAVWVVQAKDDS